jgi:alpha-tubulin suppressor-like RCC1 family protein
MKKNTLLISFTLSIIISSLTQASSIQNKAVQISAGCSHSLSLKADGSVWAWGYNRYGQLGDGTTTNRRKPVQVSNLSHVSMIAAGYHYNLALKNDGSVWAWGHNSHGQLGDGSTTNKSSPAQVLGLSDIIMIAAGNAHGIALKADGSVWSWGNNLHGQLGDGSTINQSSPVQVPGLSHISMIAGSYHNLALKDDGSVWSWGYNKYGQLGNGNTTNQNSPVLVSGLSHVTFIAVGLDHSLALKDNSSVWAWGNNNEGQLGDGITTNKSSPIQVSELSNVFMIAAGAYQNFIIKNDDSIWAWGYNHAGQLGDGRTTNKSNLVKLSGLSNVSMVAAGYDHGLALKNDGSVWAWGNNEYGQLGDGGTTNQSSFVQVSGLSHISMIVAESHSLALNNDSSVWVWGNNEYGQLGDGSTINKSSPVVLSGLSHITMIAAGSGHSLAIKDDDSVWAWGRNNFGQLGDASTINKSSPVLVSGLSNITMIAAGSGHSLAIKDDGSVWAWGYNVYGQLGDGSTKNKNKPVQVSGLSQVIMVTADTYHSLALKEDGSVWAWGNNGYGELGDGSTTNKSSPVKVSGLSKISMISTGEDHSLALKDDGTVWAWGRNIHGQLGDGTLTSRSSPVQVSGLTNVSMIAAGNSHNLALKNDGSIWSWGYNYYGLLGDGSTINQSTPVQVAALSHVSMIAAGDYHSLAIKNDGTIWAWGYNKFGQLGYGYPTYLPEPVISEIQFISKTFTTSQNTIIKIPVINTAQKFITFSYTTSDNTAIESTDYISTLGNLYFQTNETQKEIHITILNNPYSYYDKTFMLILNASENIFLNDSAQTKITISSRDLVDCPYIQNFTQNMPASGWIYYSSTSNGRIQQIGGRLRMDTNTDLSLNLNEATLNIDLPIADKTYVRFFQKSIASDICTSLPAAYTDHFNGDGVSISTDGRTWYRITASDDLLTDNLGKNYTIDLSEIETDIQTRYDENFLLNGLVQIKFQQYGNRTYPSGGREWDDIEIISANLPVVINLINDPNPLRSKTWHWSSSSNCTFRFAIDQNTTWQPTGNFTNIQTATKSNGDGTWYLHVQAKDMNDNLSEVLTVSTLLDNTKPEVELNNNLNQWQWSANENCTFRFAIDKNSTWEASGDFIPTTRTIMIKDEGTWYLHVQAKDVAGNISEIISKSITLEKPTVQFKTAYSENFEHSTSVHLELQLSRIIDKDVTISYICESTDAFLDKDYFLPDEFIVTIESGNLTGFITFTVVDDHLSELNEIITFSLQSAQNATLKRKLNHIYTIKDNDYPNISITQIDDPIEIMENTQIQALSIVLDTEPRSKVDIRITHPQIINILPASFSFFSDNWNIPKRITMIAEDNDIYQGNILANLIFQVTSKDTEYDNTYIPNIQIQLIDNETPPKPPEVSIPNTPTNNYTPRWTWTSGGGSNTFRFKLDDDDLYIDAAKTNNTWFQPSSDLSQGYHTLYVQELIEPDTNHWTDSASSTIEIDTGLPCSSIVSISPIDAASKQLTITYQSDDIYWGEICGNTNSGSGIKKVELWVSEPETNQYEKMITDTVIDGQFTYTVSQEGKYKFHVCAVDKANNSEMNYPPDPNQVWDGESIYANNFSGYAFLAVGSIAGQEGLASHTLTANNIYKQLIHRNFWPEHIKYFNPYDERQPGETDFDEHGGTYYEAFEHVITQWAPEQINKLPGPLYIILIDHGSPDIFHLTGTQSLTAYRLNQYLQFLDHLENKEEIIIILGTCFSGSFIDDISAKGRVIVTSAAANEPSYRGPKINPGGVRDGGFFISNLFNELAKGNNLLDSFNTAVLRTESFTFSTNTNSKAPFNDFALQHPLLDDNGQNGSNFLPLNGDGQIAQNIILGHNENQAVENFKTTMTPMHLNYNENTLNVEVSVNDTDQVKRLWIEIRKPDISLEDMRQKYFYDQTELQQCVELEEFDLVFNPQKDNYSLKLDRFDIPGQYIIFFYVKDKEDITSGFKESVVYKSKENNQPPLPFQPISPMMSNDTELSDVILEWENTRDPENDKISYSVILSTDTDTIIKERIFDTIYFVSLPKYWDKKEVFWKVQAIDNYGNITETPQWRFTINNNVDTWGTIAYFQVYDMDTQMPVPNSKVNIVSSDINLDLRMHSNGVYIKRFIQSGIYNVSVSADNYAPLHNEFIDIIPGQVQSFNFSLDFQSSLGDLNRNGKRDVGDAIKCLQVLGGIDDKYYYDPSVLIGDVLELRDAIYILQQLSDIK